MLETVCPRTTVHVIQTKSYETSKLSRTSTNDYTHYLELRHGKPNFGIRKNKSTDLLHGWLRYIDDTVLRLLKYTISSHLLYPACVGHGRKPLTQVFSYRGSILVRPCIKVVSLLLGRHTYLYTCGCCTVGYQCLSWEANPL